MNASMTASDQDLLALFSVNHYLCPVDMPVLGFLDAVAECGYGGVGLTERVLQELSPVKLKHELSARGLTVSSWNSARDFLLSGPALRERLARNTALLACAQTVGHGALNVIVGGSGEQTLGEARGDAAQHLAAFARRAGDAGVPLVIEPMHPLNATVKCCINTLAQAIALARQIAGVSVNLDLFHMWWDPDLDALAGASAQPLGLYQISNVQVDPRTRLPSRMPLAEGFAPWAALLRQIRQAHPRVPLELELFADQVGPRPMHDILQESARLLTGALRDA